MVITYIGGTHIKISSGEKVLSIYPQDTYEGKKAPRYGADIVLSRVAQQSSPDKENTFSYGGKSPFFTYGPGEYEIGGVYVRGIASGPNGNPLQGQANTIYTILLEGITLCHLGNSELAKDSNLIKEKIGTIDILFLYLTERGNGPEKTYTKATFLEPKTIIPLFTYSSSKKVLSPFLKEAGLSSAKPSDKLTLRKKDLETAIDEVTVLKSVV